MNGPLPSAALGRGNPYGASRRQVHRSRPNSFDERLRGKKFSGFGIEHEKEPVLWRGHGHVAFLAVDDEVGHHNVIVFGVHAFGAGLVMPGVFSCVCVQGDDAFAEQPVALRLNQPELSVIHTHARGSENDLVCRVVVSYGVPNVAAANPPPSVAGPSLRGHFQSLRFEWLRGITRNRPEAPRFLAGFRVIGNQCAAHAVIRTVVAHQNFPFRYMWRAGDAGLRRFADCGLPNFFRGCRIDGHQAAVACADVYFAVPNGNAAIGPRGIRTVDSLVQAHLRIEFPQQFPRGCLHRINFRKRCADVDHSIDNDRLRHDAHGAVHIQRPGQA